MGATLGQALQQNLVFGCRSDWRFISSQLSPSPNAPVELLQFSYGLLPTSCAWVSPSLLGYWQFYLPIVPSA